MDSTGMYQLLGAVLPNRKVCLLYGLVLTLIRLTMETVHDPQN